MRQGRAGCVGSRRVRCPGLVFRRKGQGYAPHPKEPRLAGATARTAIPSRKPGVLGRFLGAYPDQSCKDRPQSTLQPARPLDGALRQPDAMNVAISRDIEKRLESLGATDPQSKRKLAVRAIEMGLQEMEDVRLVEERLARDEDDCSTKEALEALGLDDSPAR